MFGIHKPTFVRNGSWNFAAYDDKGAETDCDIYIGNHYHRGSCIEYRSC